ncbi:hypothetical protein DMZ43_09170 [Meridianimaribacter sp. CL38]|uniref:transporter n=1 Tax=Meridianimaribacter sp. CL38 TaxID=2213021 RepID=UPI00103CB41C|nr:transporter [Meridianimaribacter sp. CL38]TBV26065.1 hypothetical protein DMZ43_09170 [Meridianimaribacter sp. CL38]
MMKDFQNTKTILLILAIISFTNSYSCDLCGCTTSSGSASFGDLQMTSFVGLRYIYQTYESKNGIFDNSPTSEEQFNTYQLWARVPLGKSFYVSAILPYQDLSRKFQGNTESINGVGDMTLIGWYNLKIYKSNSENKEAIDFSTNKELTGHSFNFGLGVKAPTGKFEEELTDRVNPGFQVGTGSWDAIATVMYNYGNNNLGLNTTFAYYLKSENKNEYRFGNQFSVSSNLFYKLKTKKMDISPFVGISGDVYDSIEQYGETLADTNGHLYNCSLGSEFNLKDFQLGLQYTLPIHQDFFGGNVEAKNRFSVYLNYKL